MTSASAATPIPFDNTAALYRTSKLRIDGTYNTLKDAAAHSKLSPKVLNKIDGAARAFEANFLSEMMKPMFEGIKVDPMLGGGRGEEVFRGFLLQEYGKKIAATGGIGIASMVRDQLIRQQERTIR